MSNRFQKRQEQRSKAYQLKRAIEALFIVTNWDLIKRAFLLHKPQGIANVRYCYKNQEPRIAPEIICHLIEKRKNYHGKIYRHIEAVYSEAVW